MELVELTGLGHSEIVRRKEFLKVLKTIIFGQLLPNQSYPHLQTIVSSEPFLTCLSKEPHHRCEPGEKAVEWATEQAEFACFVRDEATLKDLLQRRAQEGPLFLSAYPTHLFKDVEVARVCEKA
jgi:hypothetical protein